VQLERLEQLEQQAQLVQLVQRVIQEQLVPRVIQEQLELLVQPEVREPEVILVEIRFYTQQFQLHMPEVFLQVHHCLVDNSH
jgi:hypothetical protein